MKKVYIILSAVLLSSAIIGQNKNNLPRAFAYSREVLQGVNPTPVPDEKGGSKKAPGNNTIQYLIYLEEKNSTTPMVQFVWVNNKKFTVTQEKITTPVVIENLTLKGNKPDTLVSPSKNTIWQLQLKKEITDPVKNAYISNLLQKNAMVIESAVKGKKNLIPVKEIKKLAPLPLQ